MTELFESPTNPLLKLADIATALKDPSRLVGIHFFNPVAKMQLVEIIHAENTGAIWKALRRRSATLRMPSAVAVATVVILAASSAGDDPATFRGSARRRHRR